MNDGIAQPEYEWALAARKAHGRALYSNPHDISAGQAAWLLRPLISHCPAEESRRHRLRSRLALRIQQLSSSICECHDNVQLLRSRLHTSTLCCGV